MNDTPRLYGIGRIYKRRGTKDEWPTSTAAWWIEFWNHSRQHRESAHTTSRAQATRLLKQRIAEISTGNFIPHENRLTFDALESGIVNDYEINGRRSKDTILYFIKHLKQFFGSDRAIDITPDRVKAYQVHRQREGAANATVNREVSALGRMLSLAYESGKLARKPRFKLLDGERVREGFLEHGDYLTLLGNLPDYIKPVVEFLYLSGWRKGEALSLEWKDVDLQGQNPVVRLRIEKSKNKESRILPLTGRLLDLIKERVEERRLDCLFVFSHNGKPIGDFKKSWKSACIRVGLGRMERQEDGRLKYAGTIPHDLRRCAARNLSRAGVPESVAMQLTGHKTSSMYRRYRIVDERDLSEATQRMQAHLNTQPTTPHVVSIAAER